MRIVKIDPRRFDWQGRADDIADNYAALYHKRKVHIVVRSRRATSKHPEITFGRAYSESLVIIWLGTSENDVETTIVHELAHCRVGLQHMHDRAWANAVVDIALDLGYDGDFIEREIEARCSGHAILRKVWDGRRNAL